MARWSGPARVFVGPAPLDGPHPGYRGYIFTDERGVSLEADRDVEYLVVLPVRHVPGTITDHKLDWVLIERDMLLPWHTVDMIEWHDDDD